MHSDTDGTGERLREMRAEMKRRRGPSWVRRAYRLMRDRDIPYIWRRALLLFRRSRPYWPDWVRTHDTLTQDGRESIRRRIAGFLEPPLISVLMPVRDPTERLLRSALDAVTCQIYGHWELTIVGNARARNTVLLLDQYALRERRITVRQLDQGGDLTQALNDALAAAQGEFVVLLDQHDVLAPHALYMLAEEALSNPDAGIVYSDGDSIDGRGRRFDPHFKTGWNPDLFLSQNFMNHLTAFRRDLTDMVGGFRAGFEGAHIYDLALRIVERIPADSVRHVPFLLYHRRGEGRNPSAQQGQRSGLEAVRQHLSRSNIAATVEPCADAVHRRVRFAQSGAPPSVSLIIPTRDRVELLRGAVESILRRTDYPDYEVVVVDNGSRQQETLDYLDRLRSMPRVRVLRYARPFNYSAINNFAASECSSHLLAFVNSDVLVINDDWLGEMVSHAMRQEVGAVGAMLYYPDDTIQHAGVVIGFGETAVHAFRGLPRGHGGYCSRARLLQNYSAVTGACLLTRAELYAELGGFNESDLGVAFNDVDYCLRLRERKYLVTWTPYAELYHLESASRGFDFTADKIDRYQSEVHYLRNRWPQLFADDPYYNPSLSISQALFDLSDRPRNKKPWLQEN